MSALDDVRYCPRCRRILATAPVPPGKVLWCYECDGGESLKPTVTREQAIEAMAQASWHGTDPAQWVIALEIAAVSYDALVKLGVIR